MHGPNEHVPRMSACTGGRWHECRGPQLHPLPFARGGGGGPETQQTWAQPWLICLDTHLAQLRCCQEDMCA